MIESQIMSVFTFLKLTIDNIGDHTKEFHTMNKPYIIKLAPVLDQPVVGSTRIESIIFVGKLLQKIKW